jgi:DNA-binding LytR/AlgR family response regulator
MLEFETIEDVDPAVLEKRELFINKVEEKTNINTKVGKAITNNKPTPEDVVHSNEDQLIPGIEDMESEKTNITDIIYLQSWGNYVKVFTHTQMILASISTQGLLDMLPSSKFIRVHKSFTINKDYVTSWNQKEVVVISNVIPIGISYRQSIQNALNR